MCLWYVLVSIICAVVVLVLLFRTVSLISRYRVVQHFERMNDAVQVESTGALPPDVLVVEALGILKEKCIRLMQNIESVEEDM
eukprot:m.8194 g.8194  ORF g.8194 m.8194 type:complete len:83 (+) comp6041_c0_seq2:988-1236(+)